MGERKVLVRYIPPDFDPSIIPKFKRDKNRICEVRTMLPFSIRCSTCGEYMGRGKKFNSKKEMCEGDTYMGIRRFRFLIKCSVCSAQISFKTDPKNSDYEMEYGASRNFEVWKDNEAALEEDQKRQAEEEEQDAMRALENRTLDSKHEMDILDALDETMAINRRHQRIDTDAMLSRRSADAVLTAVDESLMESFRENRKRKLLQSDDTVTLEIKGVTTVATIEPSLTERISQQLQVEKNASGFAVATKIVPKRKKIAAPGDPMPAESCASSGSSLPPPVAVPELSLSGLFATYGSSSGDDE